MAAVVKGIHQSPFDGFLYYETISFSYLDYNFNVGKVGTFD